KKDIFGFGLYNPRGPKSTSLISKAPSGEMLRRGTYQIHIKKVGLIPPIHFYNIFLWNAPGS
ncbi:MAG: hypothetical protein WBB24_15735, partial [Maribacter sp.]